MYRLSPVSRLLFPAEDDAHLKLQEEDGVTVEPDVFLPIIPTLLANGSTGIGTGWSTSFPPFNPVEVAEYVRCKLSGQPSASTSLLPLRPWVRGFKGTIRPLKDGYESCGVLERCSDGSLLVRVLHTYYTVCVCID